MSLDSSNVVDPAVLAQTLQRQAASPHLNVFVSANAGAGKTRVLVDRVVRLMRTGVEPDKILCLTYTKAAANEMQGRLFKRLGGWSVMADAELANDLRELDPDADAPSADELRAARSLFARALETPGGLKVQTIHAFCERLLRRFPIEAGVEPGFEILDDAQGAVVSARARRRIASHALGEGAGGEASAEAEALSAAFNVLSAQLDDGAFDDFLKWAVRTRFDLQDALARHGGRDAMTAALADRLGVAEDATPDTAKAAAWAAAPREELEAAARALATGSKTDISLSNGLALALAASEAVSAFDLYTQVIFTRNGAGDLRASFGTKKTVEAAPNVTRLFGNKKDGYGAEALRMEAARDQVRAAAVLATTRAGLVVAQAYLAAFEAEKARLHALDFADLIEAARRLVRQSDAAEWVLFKLDGGVEHVLVDEAQDTAPAQWDIIDALTTEFYAGGGAGAREATRTTFIVGDEKQSIYSFQGADPAKFLEASQRLAKRVSDAGAEFSAIPFNTSFRCAPQVLAAVDATFALPDATALLFGADGAPTTTDPVHHLAARRGAPGLVEWWPLEERILADEPEDVWAPVDAQPVGDARAALADRIARTIRDWIDNREGVVDRDAERAGETKLRPMRPGDVMILVRKRDAVFETVIRRLKHHGVPVAGADRMTLREQLAVEDLLGAARVALLPEDDLALAEFLKSPLVHPVSADRPPIDEDALFALAHGREGSLWRRLAESDDARFAEAQALVKDLVRRAEEEGPFVFLSGLVDRASATGESYARRIYQRLGPEAEDPIEELLARALAHERRVAPSLERFVHETLNDEVQVKREGSDAADVVRVMTVHGAKGLEAPVVIVPDQGGPGGGARDASPLADEAVGYIWSPFKGEDAEIASTARAAREAANEAERLRQLYVAMTRAEDRLILCAPETGRTRDEASWHALTERGLQAAGAEPFEAPTGSGWRLGVPGKVEAEADTQASGASKVELPVWATTRPAPEPDGVRYVTPAQGFSATARPPAVLSPLAEGGAARFRRGRLVHKLLEFLPDVDRDRREASARRFLDAEGEFDDAAAQALLDEVFGVLDDPAFADLFGPQSRGEAPLAGGSPHLPAGVIVNGRVDRLAITATDVLIVDYKTDRPPPDRAEDVDSVYVEQMAAYRALLRALHPDKVVRAALLWTDGPRLMALPEELLDRALARA